MGATNQNAYFDWWLPSCTFLFVLNRSLDGNVLWNVSFHVTIMVICVCSMMGATIQNMHFDWWLPSCTATWNYCV